VAIFTAILERFPDLNDPQRAVIAHSNGPLLVIAGPGSGKTYPASFWRTKPLATRLGCAPRVGLSPLPRKPRRCAIGSLPRHKKLDYRGDLSELRVSTKSTACATAFWGSTATHTALGNNYETLDELTQSFSSLSIRRDHRPEENGLYLGPLEDRWTAIEGARVTSTGLQRS